MNYLQIFTCCALFLTAVTSCQPVDEKVVIFLHNRFLETHEMNDSHPEYGMVDYHGILQAFKNDGFKVISEKRNGNVNARTYALDVVHLIDSLIDEGIDPNRICIVGTSKGGYIAQYVSTFANNDELNFVFIASYMDGDISRIPEINYCGNILTIYDISDPFGESAIERKEASTCAIEHYGEVEINTGIGHGFLFKPMDEWIKPTIRWANGNYNMK